MRGTRVGSEHPNIARVSISGADLWSYPWMTLLPTLRAAREAELQGGIGVVREVPETSPGGLAVQAGSP